MRRYLVRGLWAAFALFNLAMLVMQYQAYSSGTGVAGAAVIGSTISALLWLGVWAAGLLLFGFIALIVWDHGKRPTR